MTNPAKPKSDARPLATNEADLPLEQIVPDPNNRDVALEADTGGDEWEQFVDSIRVRGVIQRVEVCDRGDGHYDLIEGERRWRAARVVGLATLPARVWPAGTRRAELIELGLIINVQRKEHGCLEIAGRLRELKNQHAATLEQLAARTGLKLDKVKQYVTLYEASDELLGYFQEHQPPLRVAVLLVRFGKKHGEPALRRLLAQAATEPLTVATVSAARQRLEKIGDAEATSPGRRSRGNATGPQFVARLVSALEARPDETAAVLQAALVPRGYQLVRFEGRAVDLAALDEFLRTRGGSMVVAATHEPAAKE